MPEWGAIPIPAKLQRRGVTDMVRLLDVRMCGTSYGTVVLHVCPEAAAGRLLDLLVSPSRPRIHLPGYPRLYTTHRRPQPGPQALAQSFPEFRPDMGLLKNTSNRPHRNFTLPRNNCRIGVTINAPDEFYMASALGRLEKANRFQPSLHLTKGEWFKLPQPRPQPSATTEAV